MISQRKPRSATLAVALIAFLPAAGRAGETQLIASNGATEDVLGTSVSVSGDVVVVGALGDDVGGAVAAGSARVFRWNGIGWSEEAELTSSSGAASDYFGMAVSVSGDVIVVGARGDDVGGMVDAGSATVFRWNGTSWLQEAQLTSSNGEAIDQFGCSVSVRGDVIVVGAWRDDIQGKTDEGSATVFRWNGTIWTEEVELTSSNGAAFDRFGVSVSVDGDVIVVGAPHDDIEGNQAEGSMTVFRWNGTDWMEEAELTSSSGAAIDLLGGAVSVNGDLIVGGAEGDDVEGNAEQGSARVFRWNGLTWSEEQELNIGNAAAAMLFGTSVSVSADVIVVGALWDDVGGSPGQGSATVFRWNGTSWVEEQVLTASNGGAWDILGYSVAVAGETVVAGSPGHDVGGNSNQGAAYVYDLPASPWTGEGNALAGTHGYPVLTGTGALVAGDPFGLTLIHALENKPAALVIGLTSISAPFKGGVMVPQNDILILGLSTGPVGQIVLGSTWPAGIPAGTATYYQYWISDPAGPVGFAASNAVSGSTP